MSGVDQVKIPGNTGKGGEEGNIPWSQQVDEASYENQASPLALDNSANNQNLMQFQYPPFNANENQILGWNNSKPRKQSNNYDLNKKYGKTVIYNSKPADMPPNVWNSQRVLPENARPIKSDESYKSIKLDNRQKKLFEDNKSSTTVITTTVPKKTTWASIASQPAKLTSRTTLTTSSHKKKGPGMPPPPMVPGKHNFDVNIWEPTNNNTPPIPSPPPQIDQSSPNFSSNCTIEPSLGVRQEKSQRQTVEFVKKEANKINPCSNNGIGRIRNSPNSRKSWLIQPQIHSQRASDTTSPPSSLNHAVEIGGDVSNQYGERQGNYSRNEYESNVRPLDLRDENCPRNSESVQNNADSTSSCDGSQAVLEDLRLKNNYNPAEIDIQIAKSARFFVIKSYSEDDIHRSIKYEIWCSTDHGNKRLDDAFKERQKESGHVLLFFSVNGSGHFCGMAQMMTSVDYNSTSSVWSEDKWKGKFKVKWIYVKDVPNIKLRHIRLENNDNKSVTNSRDTQEVPNARGIEVLQVLHSFKHSTSIFDDFSHYEKKQEEEVSFKRPSFNINESYGPGQQPQPPVNRHFYRRNDEREREREVDARDMRGTTQKYFSDGSSFRSDRNSIYRSTGYHKFSEYRRGSENQRTVSLDYHHKDRVLTEAVRGNDFIRHIPNSEYSRREELMQVKPKITNRDRDLSAEQNKSDNCFRSGPAKKDLTKDT